MMLAVMLAVTTSHGISPRGRKVVRSPFLLVYAHSHVEANKKEIEHCSMPCPGSILHLTTTPADLKTARRITGAGCANGDSPMSEIMTPGAPTAIPSGYAPEYLRLGGLQLPAPQERAIG
jgi:hypothetical protein